MDRRDLTTAKRRDAEGGRWRTLAAVVSVAIVVAIATLTAAEPRRESQPPRRRAKAAHSSTRPPCGNPFAVQVLLDRQGFSPGQIDGTMNANTGRAVASFQAARQLSPTGRVNCETWRALGGDAADPVAIAYEVSPKDASGPFTLDPSVALEEQAKLPALEYRSTVERLAERFHVAPALLRAKNRGGRFTVGDRILVPAVTPFDATAKPAKDATINDVTILVSREASTLRATRPDGTLVFFAPVSSGSVHDPLPPGDWTVTGVSWRPVFHYDPDLFWNASPTSQYATIKAGPNNPVGVVWISLNLEHYGLHGTPEPGRIGTSESHGCVRLTNWDAAKVASLVRPGTPVVFR